MSVDNARQITESGGKALLSYRVCYGQRTADEIVGGDARTINIDQVVVFSMDESCANGKILRELTLKAHQIFGRRFTVVILINEARCFYVCDGSRRVACNHAGKAVNTVVVKHLIACDRSVTIHIVIVDIHPGVAADARSDSADEVGRCRANTVVKPRIVTANNRFAVAGHIKGNTETRCYIIKRGAFCAGPIELRQQIGSDPVCRCNGRFAFRIGMIEPYAKIQCQAVHTPRITRVNTKTIDVKLCADGVTQLGRTRSGALISA